MKLSKLFTTALIPILFLATTFYNKPFEVNAEDIEYTYLEIEDDTLFGFPENFDVQTFLDSQPGPLNNYVEENEGHMVSAATAIDFYSQLSGIDPRILLTLIEVKSRTISDPSATNGQIKTCLGNQDVQTIGFFAQLRWGVDTLLDSYDQAMETDIPKKITFFDNEELTSNPSTNPASYALYVILAQGQSHESWIDMVGDSLEGFEQTYTNFFGSLESNQINLENQITALDGLRLPWGNGETWYYTGGPHTASAGGRSYSKGAIDFAPGGGSGCFNSASWVRAAKAGTVVYANCNFVRIDHGGSWSTGYFHLSSIQVSVGQQVAAGTILGHPSCGTGASCGWVGRATGSHVHFDTRINNQPQRIAGTNLDGWVVGVGSADYYGTMTLGSVVKNAAWWHKNSSNGITATAIDTDTDDARTIASGQTLNGRRDPQNDQDPYYLNLQAGQTVTIDMVKTTDTFDPYLTLKKQNGLVVAVDDDGGEGRNARIIHKASSSERYQIVASGWSTTTGNYSLSVNIATVTDIEDNNWLEYDEVFNGKIDNNYDEDTFYFSGVAGRIVTISMWKLNNDLDSFLELYKPVVGTKIAENDDGGGNRNSMISLTLGYSGTYRVLARSWGKNSNGDYQIRITSTDPTNYALNKPVHVSSSHISYFGRYAVDGDHMTSWLSEHGNDPQWIYVDLGSNIEITTIGLQWDGFQTAPDRYGLYIWNGTAWELIHYTENCTGGGEFLFFPTIMSTRYVMVYSFAARWPWGISLREIQVYNDTERVMPIPYPEDPYKDPENIEETVPPLPATSPDKDDGVLALTMGSDGGQEFIPPLSTYSGETPIVDVNLAGLPTAKITAIHFDDTLAPNQLILYTFHGSANDNDFEDEGEPIVAYEWSSNLDGLLSTDPDFSKLSIDLSVGTHTISFKAKDNEGNWSEISTMELIIEHPASFSRIFLPLLNK